MSHQQIQAALRALPQFDHIRPQDAQTWLATMAKRDPSRLMWHISRLASGFGGSEIGCLVLDALGRNGPFSSARELANEKLMRVLPSPTTHGMRKGILLEDAAIRAVILVHGGEFVRATSEAFRTPCANDPIGIGGNPDFPWRVNGQNILADVKLPMSGVEAMSSDDKHLMYCVQLNVYNMLNNARALEPFDRLVNLHIELPPAVTDAMLDELQHADGDREEIVERLAQQMASLLRYNRPGMRINLVDQPINPTIDLHGERPLQEVIADLAALNYQCVLSGLVPEPKAVKPLSINEQDRQQLDHLQQLLIQQHAIADLSSKRIEDIHKEISRLGGLHAAPGDLSSTPHVLIKNNTTLNADAAIMLCQRYGIDTETLRESRDQKKTKISDYDTLAMAKHLGEKADQFLKPAPLSAEKVIQALSEVGEHPARAIRYQTRISRSQKAATKTLISERCEQLGAQFDTLSAPHAPEPERSTDPLLEDFAQHSTDPTPQQPTMSR